MACFRTIIVAAAAVALAAPGAQAQTATRTFHLTTVSTLAGINEIATIIRTLDVGGIAADTPSRTVTVTGTEEQLALAEWLVGQLDSEHPQSLSPQYQVAGSAQDIVRIFYLANTPSQAGLNELVTSLRVLGDIQRIFTYSPPKAIAMRTTAAKAQLADWLVQQLDVTPGSHPALERYPDSGPNGPGEIVEVAFLRHERTQSGLHEAVTVLRTTAGIRYIFTRSAPQGIAFRGSAEQVENAERVLQQIGGQ